MNFKDYVFIVLILIVIGLVGWLIYHTTTESGKCIMNPLIYGVSQVKSAGGPETNVECSCYAPNAVGLLRFNSSSLWIEPYGQTAQMPMP